MLLESRILLLGIDLYRPLHTVRMTKEVSREVEVLLKFPIDEAAR